MNYFGFCYVLTTNQSWTLSYWCCYNDVDRCRCMLVASVFAAYGQNLNEETKFFDNPCLRPNDGCGCACISGGYFGNFCFGDLAGTRLPCPVPWNQGNKLCPCMICCVIWQLANICCWWGIKVWAAWLQTFIFCLLGSCMFYASSNQKKGPSCNLNWCGHSNR